MNSYNGFPGEQRRRALAWIRREQAAGRRVRGKTCEACGQEHGQLDGHSEDYSEPFGDHIGRFTLCFRCHMIVHCRFRWPAAFETYREQVKLGAVFEPIEKRDFGRIMREHLHAKDKAPPARRGSHWLRRFDLLGAIAAGAYRPVVTSTPEPPAESQGQLF